MGPSVRTRYYSTVDLYAGFWPTRSTECQIYRLRALTLIESQDKDSIRGKGNDSRVLCAFSKSTLEML